MTENIPYEIQLERSLKKFVPKKYKLSELPEFIGIFCACDFISNEDKYSFLPDFLDKYFNDCDFRNSIQGWFIYMVNNKLMGVFSSEKINELWYPGINSLCIEITDNPEELFM